MIQRRSNKTPTRRELLASEKSAIIKKGGGEIPVAIVFPNSYYVGMSNLATHLLYRTLNTIPGVICERFFLEEVSDGLSLESGRSLSSFEIIFFSLSFELDYVNIPKILSLGRIGLLAEERGDNAPLIVAGGICVTSNPEPIHAFFDLFIMGDIETTIPDFMDRYLDLRGSIRSLILMELSRFDWIYSPSSLSVSYNGDGTLAQFTPPGFSVAVRRYQGKVLAASTIIADRTEFSHMYLVEGTRGCPSRCPFCLLGNTSPCTHDPLNLPDTEVENIGIIGGGVSFHPHLIDVINTFKKAGKKVHLPSMRIDEVPLPVIDLMKDEIKTLTFGIEAATERLRRFIGKPFGDDELFSKIEKILAIKPFNLKLYFMIGLYSETRQDVEAIVDLVRQVKHLMVKKGAPRGFVGTVTVHASPFVPKPATPFQWLPMADEEELKEKITLLKRGLGQVDNTFFTHESLKYSILQGIFGRGDRRLTDTITRLARGDNFKRVAKEDPMNLNFYIFRDRDHDELFPWDFIKGPVSKETLQRRLSISQSVLTTGT